MQTVYPIIIAMIFHGMDLLTGLISAFRLKNIKSSKMRDGMFKKAGFLFCYLLAYLIDNYGNLIGLQISVKVLPIIILYAVSTEIVSIIENICKINEDLLPEKLKNLFQVAENGGE